MNLLSELSSELAVAILIDRKQTEKVDSKQALELLGRVYEILQPNTKDEENKTHLIQSESSKSANH
jgi:hypothetical protein